MIPSLVETDILMEGIVPKSLPAFMMKAMSEIFTLTVYENFIHYTDTFNGVKSRVVFQMVTILNIYYFDLTFIYFIIETTIVAVLSTPITCVQQQLVVKFVDTYDFFSQWAERC